MVIEESNGIQSWASFCSICAIGGILHGYEDGIAASYTIHYTAPAAGGVLGQERRMDRVGFISAIPDWYMAPSR